MKVQTDREGRKHAHAFTRYDKNTNWKHYLWLVASILDMKIHNYDSLTVHLPFEIQHPYYYSLSEEKRGYRFIRFGEWLKEVFKVKIYWENAPRLRYGKWDLAHKNTSWTIIPKKLDLCLDTGHLMVGLSGKREFEGLLEIILSEFGGQIKHLHLHENDLVHDKHWHTRKILTPELVKKITTGRTFIWEMN